MLCTDNMTLNNFIMTTRSYRVNIYVAWLNLLYINKIAKLSQVWCTHIHVMNALVKKK